MSLRFLQLEHTQSIELFVARLQLDNALQDTQLPIALAAAGSSEGEEGGENTGELCLHVSLTRNLQWSTGTLLYLDYVGIFLHSLQACECRRGAEANEL